MISTTGVVIMINLPFRGRRELLSRLSLSLDEAKLSGGATVVRLRTGAFPKWAEAAALCARLAAKHQNCLVVRTAAHD